MVVQFFLENSWWYVDRKEMEKLENTYILFLRFDKLQTESKAKDSLLMI